MQTIKCKKRLLVGVLVLLMITVIIIGSIILINKHDEKYWESQGSTWKKDCTFLGITDIDNFDPEKLESKDRKLVDTSLELLQDVLKNECFNSTYITVDKEQIEHLSPDSCKYINAFMVVQKDDKAVVTFRYSSEEAKIEEAVETCRRSYKTYPYDKIYLVKKDSKWVVEDVFRAA